MSLLAVMQTKRPFNGENKRRNHQLSSRGFTCQWKCCNFPSWSSCFQFSLYFQHKGGKLPTRYVGWFYSCISSMLTLMSNHTLLLVSAILQSFTSVFNTEGIKPTVSALDIAFLKRCAWGASVGFPWSETALCLTVDMHPYFQCSDRNIASCC